MACAVPELAPVACAALELTSVACAAHELAPVGGGVAELPPVASRVAEFIPVVGGVADKPACGWVGEEVGEVPSLAGGGELTLDAVGLVDLKEESCCL